MLRCFDKLSNRSNRAFASTSSATIAAFCFDRHISRMSRYLSSLYSRYQVQRDQMPLSRYRALTIGMKMSPALM